MRERDEKRGGAGVAILCGMVFLFGLLLYVLSIGPWTWLMWQYPALVAWDGAYRPIYFVAEHCEPAMDALNWYIDLFRRLHNS